MIERGVERGRGFEQVADHLLLFLAAHQPLGDRHMRRQGGKHGQLAAEGLGRGNADFGPGVRRQQQVRLARHRTGGYVDDHRDGLAVLLAVPQRRQRVGGFAALRDEQRQTAFFEDRFAIAEFGGDIDVHRDTRELLEPVFGDHSGIEGRAAGHDGDALDLRQVEIELWQRDRIVRLAQVGSERLRDHGRLLEDLLLHEVAVIALLDSCGRGARGLDLAFDRLVFGIVDFSGFAGDDHPVAFLEIADLLRQRCQRQRVGTDIGFAVAIADHQR